MHHWRSCIIIIEILRQILSGASSKDSRQHTKHKFLLSAPKMTGTSQQKSYAGGLFTHFAYLQSRAMNDFVVNSKLTAPVIDDQNTDTPTTVGKRLV